MEIGSDFEVGFGSAREAGSEIDIGTVSSLLLVFGSGSLRVTGLRNDLREVSVEAFAPHLTSPRGLFSIVLFHRLNQSYFT